MVRDAIIEEAVGVVCHVVVTPGEDGTGFVSGGVERIAEDVG